MSLLDPKWKYVHSSATDLRKSFAKARRELAQTRRRPKLQLMSAAVPAVTRAENRVQQPLSTKPAPKLEDGIPEGRKKDFSTHVTSRWDRSA